MKPIQSRRLSKLYFVLIFVVYVTSLYVIDEGYDNGINNYISLKGQQFDQSILDITNTYEVFASFIFHSDIFVEDVLNLMDQASQAEINEQALIRDTLHQKLIRLYNMVQNYSFSQIQFHLPNGDSFLRFNNVNKYGDSLLDYRPALRKMMDQKQFIFGFEGDCSLSGYRFIYPLFNRGHFVGSVELVVSANSIVTELTRSLKATDVVFMIKDDIIKATNQGDLPIHHEISLLSEEYLIEKTNLAIIQNSYNSLQLIEDLPFNQALRSSIEEYLLLEQSFNTTFTYQRNDYIIHFNSIKDVTNNHVGYFYSVAKTNSLAVFAQERNQLLWVASTIMMFMISLFYFVMKKEEEISKYAMIDSLTGIYNRGTFINFSNKFFSKQKRDETPITIALVDVDNFKEVNDVYGHRVGDKILVEIVQAISESIRDSDIFARYGGDEFAILLPETEIDVAMFVLERIRSHIEHTPFMKTNSITISAGLHAKKPHESIEDAIQLADEALYKAKLNGRNQVFVSNTTS